MCGRYYVDDDTSREIRKILEQLDTNFVSNGRKTGEIFPTNIAPILVASDNIVSKTPSGDKDSIIPIPSIWGYPNFYKKGVIINARAETALEKKTFRNGILAQRCVIPSSGFYEWDSNKNKLYFQYDDSEVLYMAGIYNMYDEECRFVILTTDANDSMKDIHQRMPVVLRKDEVKEWIYNSNNTSVGRILNQVPPMLKYA